MSRDLFYYPDARDPLCEKFPSPLFLDGVFREILTEYFSSADNIQSPSLKDKIFSPNPQATKIRIEPIYRWTPELIDRVPAIILQRGKLVQHTPGLSFATVETPVNNRLEMLKLWGGEHAFICVSRLAAEAEELGFELIKLFSDYKIQITRYCNLHSFDVSSFEPLKILAETSERIFVSAVATAYTIVETLQLTFS